MKLKRFSLRFNLDREDDRRAWEALHRMDARSINREIIARINAKEQTDVLKELIRQIEAIGDVTLDSREESQRGGPERRV